MAHAEKRERCYGLMAEFDTPEALVEAARRVHDAGYIQFDAFTPFPIEGLPEAMRLRRSRLPLSVLVFGLLGAVLGFGVQYFATVVHYPINVGGRPLNSWPAYVPVTFELAVLLASLAAVVGMLVACGLPMPYHPVFNVDRFARASQDRFFLVIESSDPRFDAVATRALLESLKPHEITEVPR